MGKSNQTIRITLLGGVNEVGGNIVFLEDFGYDVKIFLDFGVNIEKFNKALEIFQVLEDNDGEKRVFKAINL